MSAAAARAARAPYRAAPQASWPAPARPAQRRRRPRAERVRHQRLARRVWQRRAGEQRVVGAAGVERSREAAARGPRCHLARRAPAPAGDRGHRPPGRRAAKRRARRRGGRGGEQRRRARGRIPRRAKRHPGRRWGPGAPRAACLVRAPPRPDARAHAPRRHLPATRPSKVDLLVAQADQFDAGAEAGAALVGIRAEPQQPELPRLRAALDAAKRVVLLVEPQDVRAGVKGWARAARRPAVNSRWPRRRSSCCPPPPPTGRAAPGRLAARVHRGR